MKWMVLHHKRPALCAWNEAFWEGLLHDFKGAHGNGKIATGAHMNAR